MISRNKIFCNVLALMLATVPVSQYISVRILLVLLVFSFFQKFNWRQGYQIGWPNLFYMLVLSFGIIYLDEYLPGLKVLETNFSVLAIGLIFCVEHKMNEQDLYKLVYAFLLGLATACMACIIQALINYQHTGEISFFYFYQLTSVINSHPTYLSYYLIFAISFGLYLLFYQKHKIKGWIIFLMLFFFFIMLILSGGLTSFISLFFVFSFFMLKFMIENRNFARWSVFVFICAMIICMIWVVTTEQTGRDAILNDSWERFTLWESAIKAMPDIFLGVGTGNSKSVLNQYYLMHGMSQFAADSYNAHNQFIQILFTNGIPGLVAVLILMCRPLYLAFKNQHALGVLVFFPFILYGTTEVFLARYQGIVFFTLLYQIFVSYYYSINPISTSLKRVEN
ncbi:MAG: O-antigen ligase family protein [Cyclobacteriaceae bacterium]|nr:O-antigen ligase family protein [Cyclobacteriaceae bacterium]